MLCSILRATFQTQEVALDIWGAVSLFPELLDRELTLAFCNSQLRDEGVQG